MTTELEQTSTEKPPRDSGDSSSSDLLGLLRQIIEDAADVRIMAIGSGANCGDRMAEKCGFVIACAQMGIEEISGTKPAPETVCNDCKKPLQSGEVFYYCGLPMCASCSCDNKDFDDECA